MRDDALILALVIMIVLVMWFVSDALR